MSFFVPIQLSGSGDSSCFLEPLNSGGGYLSCDIKKNPEPKKIIPLDIVRGYRPQICEDQKVANASPMLNCSYRFHDLRRCGCPTLDPNKNPELWEKYVESVKYAVRSKLGQDNITLTIFASGYLLQDCELLDRLFMDDDSSKWSGVLNLQFVDLNYEIKDVKKLKEVVEANATKTTIDWKLMVPAIVAGVCGGGSTIYGFNSNNEKARKVAIIAGIILIVSAVILGTLSVNHEKEKVSKFSVNDPIMKTIDQFLKVIEQQAPFRIHADFFPNAQACIEKNKKSDVVLGYDIDNTLDIFNHLRENNLKSDGKVVAVTKDELPTKEIVKVIRRASGPYAPYQLEIIR